MSGKTSHGGFSLAQRDAKSFLRKITTSSSLTKKAKLPLNRIDVSDVSRIVFIDENTRDDPQTTSCDATSMQPEMTPLVLKSRIIMGAYGLPRIPELIKKRLRAPCCTKELRDYNPRIARCTRMQVYKMANRFPAFIQRTADATAIARYPLDKEPKTMSTCNMYSSWLQRKMHLQKALLARVKLDDLLHIEKTADIEGVDIAVEWDKVAVRRLEKSDDGQRQRDHPKPGLPALPQCLSLPEPTTKNTTGINRHKVTLAENENMVFELLVPESSKRSKKKKASKQKSLGSSVTTVVEKHRSPLVMTHWRKQTEGIPRVTKKRTMTFSGDKVLKQHQEQLANVMQSQSKGESCVLQIQRRWKRAFRLTKLILTIGRAMALRSYEIDQRVKSFVDVEQSALTDQSREKGHYIDVEKYKRRNELVINSEVQSTLRQDPETRTLLQLDQAVRELQKIPVFSQYPKEIQEKVIQRATYLALGPQRVIVRKGQRATNFYIIASGTAMVKCVATDPTTGKDYVKRVSFLSQGMTFGNVALDMDMKRTTNVLSRDRMQLLTMDAKDYLEIFVSSGPSHQVFPHQLFLQSLDVMTGWPLQQLQLHSNLCSVRYFKRNFVITHDSKNSPNIYIVRSGYCKVFRMLSWPDDTDPEKNKSDGSVSETDGEKSTALGSILKTARSSEKFHYTEEKSEYVGCKTVTSPLGKKVKFPVVHVSNINDPLTATALRVPKQRRKFVPMKTLREEDVFGLDQLPLFKQRSNSRSVILVSQGADCIILDKGLFCRFAGSETSEVVNFKTFPYSDDFIKNRLKDNSNRDVYLEHVLDSYFVKLFRETNGDFSVHNEL